MVPLADIVAVETAVIAAAAASESIRPPAQLTTGTTAPSTLSLLATSATPAAWRATSASVKMPFSSRPIVAVVVLLDVVGEYVDEESSEASSVSMEILHPGANLYTVEPEVNSTVGGGGGGGSQGEVERLG